MDLDPPKLRGELVWTEEGTLAFSTIIGVGAKRRRLLVELEGGSVPPDAFWAVQQNQPSEMPGLQDTGFWAYRGKVVHCPKVDVDALGRERLMLLVKHCVLQEERQWASIERQVATFENIALASEARRQRIPDTVRLFVWQRDEGKCVECGSSERLEFDHIIPVIEGGSNTERNIQLLCEVCNRKKGRKI